MTPRSTPAPAPREPALLRDVVLVGPAGAGKTTLVEALLVAAGVVPELGDVQDGTTTCGSDEVERALGRSAFLSLAPLEHRGVKVNLLDVPGTPELVAALRAGLRAADGVLFVVSAAGGLDAVTAQLWAECEAAGVPRVVAVTQLDRARADFDEAVALCQRLLSDEVLPLSLPMHDDDGGVAGLISLIDQRVTDHSSGVRVEREADPEHLGLVADLRGELVEAVLGHSEDEALLDDYLDGADPDPDVVATELHDAVRRGHLSPAVPVAPLVGVGATELLDLLVDGFPSPLSLPSPPVTRPDGSPAAPVTADPAGPLVAEVVRVLDEEVAYVRVVSGTLAPGAEVHVAGRSAAVVGEVFAPLGRALRPVASCPAGDVCAVAGLPGVQTGDTLSAPDDPLVLAPWRLPAPQLPLALEADDDGRLAAALAHLVAQDPTVRLERSPETGQQLLWCLGPEHADVLLRSLRARVDVRTVDVVLPLRETPAHRATGTGRSGEAVVELSVAPGSGLVLQGGADLPADLADAAERGVRAQAARGRGRPLVDVTVSVEQVRPGASPQAVEQAAAHALQEAVLAAGTVVLEPWEEVEVHVPTAFARTVLSDLRGRRARAAASEADPEDDERSVVRAQLPTAELLGYAVALGAASYGTGSFLRRPLGYEPMPLQDSSLRPDLPISPA